jgi:hypothetical protein
MALVQSEATAEELVTGLPQRLHHAHAVLGVLCDAALSDSKLMEEPEFEEALFRLVVTFSRNGASPHAQRNG